MTTQSVKAFLLDVFESASRVPFFGDRKAPKHFALEGFIVWLVFCVFFSGLLAGVGSLFESAVEVALGRHSALPTLFFVGKVMAACSVTSAALLLAVHRLMLRAPPATAVNWLAVFFRENGIQEQPVPTTKLELALAYEVSNRVRAKRDREARQVLQSMRKGAAPEPAPERNTVGLTQPR